MQFPYKANHLKTIKSKRLGSPVNSNAFIYSILRFKLFPCSYIYLPRIQGFYFVDLAIGRYF